ncbi:hypothetical protein B0T24DRAFT_708585 [Lasiosphaeria ovina]|uniref:Uncharacterized protein n=1 Tax=Lasiosphaeria ovina TaxID=92902 RepID=A0AAE0N3T2_9PEZI|nr:hypothetical protein B0T24DRAFT_708585 [Lasiosphaeria ovina]
MSKRWRVIAVALPRKTTTTTWRGPHIPPAEGWSRARDAWLAAGRAQRQVVWRVHNNVTARNELGYYRVDWVAGVPAQIDEPLAMGDGAGFLETMRAGDRIALWARAEQQAWVNTIAEATIELAYEVLQRDN